MAKISANYEVVYVLDPAQGEEARSSPASWIVSCVSPKALCVP